MEKMWAVKRTSKPDELEALLNQLESDGYEIKAVYPFVSSVGNSFHREVVARRRPDNNRPSSTSE